MISFCVIVVVVVVIVVVFKCVFFCFFKLLESHLAKLMHAHQAFVTSSGMSALDSILRLLKSGDEIITGDDLYGGKFKFL